MLWGDAQLVLLNLPPDGLGDYTALSEALVRWFGNEKEQAGPTVQHQIEMGEATPIKLRPHRLPLARHEAAKSAKRDAGRGPD